MNIRKALIFASENNIALGAHIGYPDIQGFGKRKMDLSDEELEAVVIYQVSAIIAYAKTFDLEVEQVRCHGALKELIIQDEKSALIVVNAIKKVNPWLNLIVQSQDLKDLVQKEGLKAALEIELNENLTVEDVKSLEIKPDTIHFKSLEDIKKAYEQLKPTPINYNRVQNQI